MSDDSLSKLQAFAIKTCRDCPMLAEVSGNVTNGIANGAYVGGPVHLCANDGDFHDPDLVPGHECELYDSGPMLAFLVTPR